MSTSLFNEFNEVSAKAWKQQIQVELKGADFNEKLVTKTEDGIHIKPFYHQDDVEYYTEISIPDWKICQSFFIEDHTKLSTILDAVERGAEQIWLQVKSTSISVEIYISALNEKGIQPYIAFNRIHFSELNQLLTNNIKKATFYIDPIYKFGKTGNWYANQKTDFAYLKQFSTLLNFSICLQLKHYQQAGATHVQELAYAMAHINEYLNEAENQNYIKQIKNLHLQVAVGGNYFFEIAKLRAIRVLTKMLLSEYGLEIPLKIMVEPSNRNKTLYDYNVNMLRTTTECMSAVLGGADIICNLNYDAIYHHENEFANRLSRNQLLILKHESYFDKVQNPADGSYYIQKITDQMQEKALAIFKDIEQGGGIIKQLFEGKIQRKIKEQETREQEDIASKKKKLVGTNAYADVSEKLDTSFEKNPFMDMKSRKTLIQPIVECRLAEELEKERQANS